MDSIIGFFSNEFFQIIIRFFSNIAEKFYHALFGSIESLLPDFSSVYKIIDFVFDYLTDFFVFVKDATFMMDFTYILLVAVIVLKVFGSYIVYIFKLFIKWYRQLVP